MDIKPVKMPRIASGWERDVWIKKLSKIINRNVVFFNPSEISRKPPANYDNKSPYGIARPGTNK